MELIKGQWCFGADIVTCKALAKVHIVVFRKDESSAEEDLVWKLNGYFVMKNPMWDRGMS